MSWYEGDFAAELYGHRPLHSDQTTSANQKRLYEQDVNDKRRL